MGPKGYITAYLTECQADVTCDTVTTFICKHSHVISTTTGQSIVSLIVFIYFILCLHSLLSPCGRLSSVFN